jgi:hypothetical protein
MAQPGTSPSKPVIRSTPMRVRLAAGPGLAFAGDREGRSAPLEERGDAASIGPVSCTDAVIVVARFGL